MKTKRIAIVGLIALCSAFPALAHHSFAAEFDETKPITLKGVVSKVEWENPHVYFHVDAKDEQGNVVDWHVESTSVVELIHRGWSHDSLKVGDRVIVEGFTAKNGSRLVGSRLVTLADGRKVFTGSFGDGGPGDPNKDQ
jgi:Family of unknown function (DUF6152)